MTYFSLTQDDIAAIEKAAGKNGWTLDKSNTYILEPAGRGSLRNGLCICERPNGFTVHAWSINEKGIAGLHNGNYVNDIYAARNKLSERKAKFTRLRA